MPYHLRTSALVVLGLAACSGTTGKSTQDAGNSGGANGDDNGAPNGATNASSGQNEGGTNRDAGGTQGGMDAAMDSSMPPPPACDASKAPAVAKLGLNSVVDGLSDLMMAAQAPGSSNWYLVQQSGEIRVFNGTGLEAEPFLDVSDDAAGCNECGLLGLAFDPEYASTGLFYVMLTANGNIDEVREYKRSDGNPLKADAASKRDIVVLPASDTNHNGGTVLFGPDGLLYVGTGDGGGGCNDVGGLEGAPQDVNSLFGKVLRLDPTKSAPFAADGNPFAANGDARVLHYGLRNPFRFGFDSATGDLYIGDVGQGAFEEVDFAPKGSLGLNFGWADYEGNAAETCPSDLTLRPGSTHTPPIFAPDRDGDTTPGFDRYRSIIGGVVYRGTALPELVGAYLFGDYQDPRMGALYQCEGTTSPVTPIRKACDPFNEPDAACFEAKNSIDDLRDLTAFVEGNDKELYLVANRSALYKVVPN